MRIGIVTIPRPSAEPVGARVLGIARRVEALGFAGLWVTDAFGRGFPTIDPLVLLGAVAGATERIELGTCVVQLPLRHPVEHAHRVQSLNLLSGGRLRFGIGSGSTKADFDVVGADYERRFKTLPAYLEIMQRAWKGEAGISVWPGTEGGPPVLLGAWRSARWIDLAAQKCQGWIASGIHTSWEDLEIGLRMYRAAGGARAIVANIITDLRPVPTPHPIAGHAKIGLFCSPEEARERLARLAALGVDDALLICPDDDPGQLETIRTLV
ncbi:MAG: LLM class flavin-dependent oxidoreductase [Proteobacteria bacterium]|nr:LLM class flavin-dependent oxidoreductase [Pseudomonadota bacterium]